MTKTETINVQFNDNGLPVLPVQDKAKLTASMHEKQITIEGNVEGLRLLAKAAAGLAYSKSGPDFHVHLDDLYKLNSDNIEFVIRKS